MATKPTSKGGKPAQATKPAASTGKKPAVAATKPATPRPAAEAAAKAKPALASKPAAVKPAAKPAPKAAARPKTASKAKPAPKPAAKSPPPETAPDGARASDKAKTSAAASVLDLLTGDQRDALEAISANLARAALTAQGAFADAAMRQADRPAALSPDLIMRAQADLFTRYTDLWRNASQRMVGRDAEAVVEPAKGDKRFLDPGWSENPMFDVMKQSYLLTSNWLNGLVSGVDGVDPLAKRRVEFFTKMLTDAFSPSNFLISNPAALKEIADTKGESLVRGMQNFAADLARGDGQLSISQTDFDKFKVGENIATSPGKVVFQNELIQLLQFDPSTETVHEIPLLIFPPWINKFYILDLRPENSMIRWLTSQGFTVFVASWVNPDAQLATKTFEDYMIEGVYAASQAVMTQCQVKEVNTVGYCIGGTLLSCSLAYMAAKGEKRIKTATFFAAQQDFSEAGDLLLFTDDSWINEVEKQMDEGGGVLSGQAMADTFNALRGNDLIWSFFVNNYLLGKEPKPFDLLYWNSDQTRMPKTLHLFYLREFYRDNKLSKGQLVLGGETLDMAKVKIPVFVQSSKDDHIAPFRSVYKGAKLFGGPTTFMMAGSGHIAGVINAPVAQKYQHWTNPHLPATAEEWVAGAEEHPGSWWPYWAAWLSEKSGPMVPARDPSKGVLKPIEDAPGSFVKVKS
jgi:polyhydroxyalkanoate synthase